MVACKVKINAAGVRFARAIGESYFSSPPKTEKAAWASFETQAAMCSVFNYSAAFYSPLPKTTWNPEWV